MAAASDSDEEESFVKLGNQLPQISDDDPKPKPIRMQDIQARDSQGRPRFHGAFSGGFSAGYFNTVGSKEGWTPSTFMSTNKKKTDQNVQRPEDFMDEEDFSEYGIAPRKFVTSGLFSSEERKRRHMDEMKLATSDSVIPGTEAMLDIIVPEKTSVGVKLLRKMGWREGQGIGPRISRKKKKQQRSGQKLYGCQLPSSSEDEGDLNDEDFLKDVTFAPSDVTQISMTTKDNTKGLGYRGLNPQSALPSSHINLFGPPPVTKGGKKGIRGQAFGVGAMEDEDDDIYTADHMSNYDMMMGGVELDRNFGWTAPRGQGSHKQEVPVGYIGEILAGFTLSSAQLVQKKTFGPPILPRSYKPQRGFMKPAEIIPSSPVQKIGQSARARHQDAMSRGVALGEKPFVGSVFDLLSKGDQMKLQNKGKTDTQSVSSVSEKSSSILPTVDPIDQDQVVSSTLTPSSTMIESRNQSVQSTETSPNQSNLTAGHQTGVQQGTGTTHSHGALGSGFKPFANDEQKQERYEQYLSLTKHGVKNVHSQLNYTSEQTEWDKERELDEFVQAARLYRPLSGMMAARFTTGKQTDGNTVEVKVETNIDITDAEKAANMKMYGKLTRDILEWHPDRLVCRRFNIPDPYPGSSIVGLATVKRDKYSVFNFLNFQTEAPPAEKEELLPITAPPSNDGKLKDKDSQDKSKSSEKKSIFSHLFNKGSNSSSNSKTAASVSFSIKGGKKQKEFKSIFSHLGEQTPPRPKPGVAMETDSQQNASTSDSAGNMDVDQVKEEPSDPTTAGTTVADSDEDQPPLDLFRAIFRNTDSEDSSESSSSGEEEKESENSRNLVTPQSSTSFTGKQVDPIRLGPSTDSSPVRQSSVASENISASVDSSNNTGRLPISSVRDEDEEEEEAYGPPLPPAVPSSGSSSLTNTGGPVHVFTPRNKSTLPGNSQQIEDVEARLAPSIGGNQPGTSLSSCETGSKQSSSRKSEEICIDLTKGTTKKHKHKSEEIYIDLTKGTRKKNKDKHKDSSKRKDKKEKHKKSKHKKGKKKKEKKKKQKSRYTTNSETDTSSDESGADQTDLPSDREILNRMKSLHPERRMQAADFM